MYKSRIHKWGLDKKLKEREVRAIIHMLARRRGKATRILLRGRSVDIKTAESHLKRKRITTEDVLKTVVDPLPDLICETPRMSPEPFTPSSPSQEAHSNTTLLLQGIMERRRPQHLDSPDPLKTAELLFADLRECVLSSFGTGSWVSYGPDEYCRSQNALNYTEGRGRPRLVVSNGRAVWDVYDRAPRNGHFSLERLPDKWGYDRTIDDVEAISYLIRAVAALLLKTSKSAVLKLCKQLHHHYTSLRNDDKRISSAFGRVCTNVSILVHNDVAVDYLPTALQILIDSHNQILDECHLQTVHVAVILAQVMGLLYGPAGIAKPLEALHSSLDKQHGPSCRRSAVLLIQIASIHIQCDQFGAASIIVQRLIEHAETLGLPIRIPADWKFSLGKLSRVLLRLRRCFIDYTISFQQDRRMFHNEYLRVDAVLAARKTPAQEVLASECVDVLK